MQEEYYARLGVGAWDEAVPFHSTNSACMAEAYVEAILAILEDYDFDPEQPVQILEVAAGAGRLSFLLLTELDKRLPYFPHLQRLKLRYLMTDFTSSNLEFWRGHPCFAPFVERGMLEFALFAPETGALSLPGGNPLIVLANYYFDSIRQDVFRIENGGLQEGLVTLSGDTIETAELSYSYQECSSDYYGDDRLDAILKHYLQTVPHGPIIFPVGGFRALQNLSDLSGGNFILLSSDKAYVTPWRMLLPKEHVFAVHGSFSFMVNYHAIGQWFTQAGGTYFHTETLSEYLETVACALVRQPCVFGRLRYLFEQRLRLAHPMVTVVRLVGDLCSPELDMSVRQQIDRLLALVRLSLADPRDFCLIAARLAPLLPEANMGQQTDLLELMTLAWQKFYFFRGERNLPFWFAELYYQLGRYEDSLQCLDIASRCYDEYAEEYMSLKGRAFEKLNRWGEAHAMYARALKLNPGSESAQKGLSGLQIRGLAPRKGHSS